MRRRESNAESTLSSMFVRYPEELEKGESMNPNWEVKRTGLIKVSTLEGVAGGS